MRHTAIRLAVVFRMITAGISFAAGFNAADEIEDNGNCSCGSSLAFKLGITAAVFAIITQVCISAAHGGCGCCRSDTESTPASNVICAILSWIATVVAVALLIAAASSYCSCKGVTGVFVAGGATGFLSLLLGIAPFASTFTPAIVATVVVEIPATDQTTINYVVREIPATQTTTNPAVANPVGVNVDPEKYPVNLSPKQYPPP